MAVSEANRLRLQVQFAEEMRDALTGRAPAHADHPLAEDCRIDRSYTPRRRAELSVGRAWRYRPVVETLAWPTHPVKALAWSR